MALARLLGGLRDQWPLVAVVFVDHGLRDVSAERDGSRRIAGELGVPFVERRVDLSGAAGNLQQNARRARYAVLAEEALKRSALVCTGHTRTDQAETVLGRMVRGAGLRGLAGIRARDALKVRPLLGVGRDETRALAGHFVDDPTNAGDAFLRNRLRHRVLPLLRLENPKAEEAMAAVASAVAHELELVDALGSALTDRADLSGLPVETAEAVLRWRLRRAATHALPPTRKAVRAFAEKLVSSATGRSSLGRGIAGVSHAGVPELVADDDPRTTLVAERPGHYVFEHAALTLVRDSGPMTADLISSDGSSSLQDPETAWLDPTAITWPLTFRRCRLGDPPGQPRRWLLLDGAGKVLWDPGVMPAWTAEATRTFHPPNDLRVQLTIFAQRRDF